VQSPGVTIHDFQIALTTVRPSVPDSLLRKFGGWRAEVFPERRRRVLPMTDESATERPARRVQSASLEFESAAARAQKTRAKVKPSPAKSPPARLPSLSKLKEYPSDAAAALKEALAVKERSALRPEMIPSADAQQKCLTERVRSPKRPPSQRQPDSPRSLVVRKETRPLMDTKDDSGDEALKELEKMTALGGQDQPPLGEKSSKNKEEKRKEVAEAEGVALEGLESRPEHPSGRGIAPSAKQTNVKLSITGELVPVDRREHQNENDQEEMIVDHEPRWHSSGCTMTFVYLFGSLILFGLAFLLPLISNPFREDS
jgi:hypothetical protein